MTGKKYAVLGGGGSFGIHTALYLLEHGNPEKVVGIGRSPLKPEPFSLSIDQHPRFEYHPLHITYELDLLLELLDKEKPEIIVNFAAQGESAVSWRHSWRFFETNSMALARLCEELMKRSWLERFIQVGTSEIYGSVKQPASESAPVKPSSPYATSKLAFDFYLESIHKNLGFPMNIVRPSNAYCPGQMLHRIIPKAIVYGLTGRKLALEGGGVVEKSYMHARDLGHAILLISQHAPLGKIYNAGPERPTSIRKVVEMCAEAMEIRFDQLCELAPDRLGQDSCYWLDSGEIKNDLGWEPTTRWTDGLREMVHWGTTHIDYLRNLNPEYVLRA